MDEALEHLADASLVTFSVDGSVVVTTHRLVMRVPRERRAHEGTLAVVGTGICALLIHVAKSLDEPWRNRAAARDTVQQIMALAGHLGPYLHDEHREQAEDLLAVRAWAVWCTNELGDSLTQAIEYGKPLLADRERLLGSTHPDTLISRNNLACAYRAAGRLAEAILLFERNLAVRELLLGEDHARTLMSRNNLAGAYREAGRFAEAIPLFERDLADRERLLGEVHPDTLTPGTTSLSPIGTQCGWRRRSRCASALSPTSSCC